MEFAPFIGEGPMHERYPKLARKTVFCKVPDFEAEEGFLFNVYGQPDEADLEKLIIFVSLLVEPINNPLAAEKDFSFRLQQAKSLSEIEKGSPLDRMIDDSHPWVSAVVTEYFRLTQNLDYEAWFAFKMLFHRRAAMIRDNPMLPLKELDLDSVKKKIVEYEARLFPDDRVRKMVDDDSSSETIERWAEKFARNYST